MCESSYKKFDDTLKELAPDEEGKRTFLPLLPEHMRLQASLYPAIADFLFSVYGQIDVGQECSKPARWLDGYNAGRYTKKLTDMGLLVKRNRRLVLPPTDTMKWVRVPIRWFRDPLCGVSTTDMQLLLHVMHYTIPEVELSQAQYAKCINVSRSAITRRPSEFWKRYRGNTYVDSNGFKSTATRFNVIEMMVGMNTDKYVTPTPENPKVTTYFEPERIRTSQPRPKAPQPPAEPVCDWARLAKESDDPGILRECLRTEKFEVISDLYMIRGKKPKEICCEIEAAFAKLNQRGY